MPTTVTIPVTEDYREVTLALGEADYLTSICLSPDYIFGVTDEAPAKLVRINRSNFAERSVLTFANDDEHKNGADVMHVGATVGAGIYVMFRNGPPNTLMISKVDFTTTPMTYTDWWREEDYAAGYGTMTTDDVYIYALIGPFPNAYIARMKLSDQTAVITQIPGVTFGRNLRISGSPAKLYAVGQTDPPDDGLMWVKRLRFDTDTLVVEQSTTISGGNTTVIPNNIGVELQPKDYIWVGSRDFTGTLKRIQKSNLSNVTTVATAITPSTSSGCRAMEDDNPYVWALFDNGKAVRINTDLPSLEQRTYALSGGFHYRMVSGDPYLFGSFYSAPTKIARYHIPPDVASGGLASLINIVGYETALVAPANIVVDASGNKIIGGKFSVGMKFPIITGDTSSGDRPTVGQADGFIAKYNSSNAFQWGRAFGSTSPDVIFGTAVDSSGNVIVTGSFNRTCDFSGIGGTPNPATSETSVGLTDVFIAKYDPNGTLLWVNAYGDQGSDVGNAVAVDSVGNIIVLFAFQGTINFGGAAGSIDASGGGSNRTIGIVKLDSNGTPLWAKSRGTSSIHLPTSVAIDTADNIWITGQIFTASDLGGGTTTAAGIFIAKYAGTDGSHLYSKAFGGTKGYSIAVNRSAVGAVNGIVLTGDRAGDVNFGGGTISSTVVQPFLAGFDSGGTFLWVNQMPSDAGAAGLGVAVNGDGVIGITGSADGFVRFSPTVEKAGSAFVAAYQIVNPSTTLPTLRWANTFASGPGVSVAFDRASAIASAGNFEATVDFGGQSISSANYGTFNGFVASYNI